MNKKLNQHNIQYVRALHKHGVEKRTLGKLLAVTLGVCPTTVYRYLNHDQDKYVCYSKEYREARRGIYPELNRSRVFLGSLVSQELQRSETTQQVADKFHLPLPIINRGLVSYLNEDQTTSTL